MKTLLLNAARPCRPAPCFGMFFDDGVISVGDTQKEVLKRFGDPDCVTSPEYGYSGTRGYHANVGKPTVVDWIYNFGQRRSIY